MRKTALTCAALCLLLATPAAAGVNLNIGIGVPVGPPVVVVAPPPPPQVMAPAPPSVVVIPGTPVYYAPGLNVDIFFYGGFWWTPYQNYWYRSSYYSGPWLPVQRPPRVFFNLPPHYRDYAVRERPIPYGQFRQHWRDWDRDRRGGDWDRGGWKRGRGNWNRHDD